jgi:hypothetical protein
MTFTLRKINPNVLPAEVGVWDAIPLLSGLMNDAAFLGSQVLPLVDETAEDWYVAHRHDSPDSHYAERVVGRVTSSRGRAHPPGRSARRAYVRGGFRGKLHPVPEAGRPISLTAGAGSREVCADQPPRSGHLKRV